MSAKVFLDTDVIVYAFDPTAPEKQAQVRALMAGDDWVIRWQVIQEFSNVALHRFAVPMAKADLQDFLRVILWPHCEVWPSPELFEAALATQQHTQYRFCDSLIVAGAMASGASVLYSEDLQADRKIGGVTVQNPFR
tara:strand:- start:464 stop:874 length:411 start_codon:yes stop_codon:yes gene_type:complete